MSLFNECVDTPVNDDVWVDTPDGDLQVVGRGTMLIKGTRYGKPKDLLFENVAYVSNSKVSMISVNKLKKKGFYWDMAKNVLYDEKSGAVICDIYEHFGLPTLEFNPVPSHILANSMQPRNQAKATPWL